MVGEDVGKVGIGVAVGEDLFPIAASGSTLFNKVEFFRLCKVCSLFRRLSLSF